MQPSHLWFRVYWFDCDLNGHLTNSKYLAFMDLGRVSLIQQAGYLKVLYKKKWFPVLQSVDMTFIKEIKPFAKIYLTTQLLGADDKYLYLEQKFYVNNALCCVARVRALFVGPKGRVSLQEFLDVFETAELPETPNSITLWKNYLLEKKNETQ